MFRTRWSRLGEQIYDRDVLGGPDPSRPIDPLAGGNRSERPGRVGGAEPAQVIDLLGGPDKGQEDLLTRPLITMAWPY